MANLDIYNKVRVVPQEAQKKITGGRLNGMTDINPMWRIKVLTELFGPCGFGWYYEIENKWTDTIEGSNEVAAFVEIKLYVKHEDEWSKGLTGLGGSKLASNERSGLYVDDECYKKALTDAISVACKSLGIGADVYWDKDRTKYSQNTESDKKTVNVPKVKEPLLTEAHMGEILQLLAVNGINYDSVFQKPITKVLDKNYDAMLKHLLKYIEDVKDLPEAMR